MDQSRKINSFRLRANNANLSNAISSLTCSSFTKVSIKPKRNKILVGDLNIAPLEHDVWSHKQLINVVSHTPIETEALLELIKTGSWIDVMREFVPQNEKLYSWWSYRNRNWEISNRGRRLDHFWVTKNLFPQVKSGVIYKEIRSWERPSDHVPIVVDIDI